MRVLVLGASGATGREVVRQALAQELSVTAFVRDPARLQVAGPTLRVVQGDVGDYAAVAGAVEGQEAVISTLGVSRPLHADPVVVEGIRHTLRAMEEHRVSRLVYLSFIGVRESRAAAGFAIRNIAKYPLRHEIADHEAKEALIRANCFASCARARMFERRLDYFPSHLRIRGSRRCRSLDSLRSLGMTDTGLAPGDREV
jgi:putative NADH-flavin reductase